jgi:hypothetical protein
MVVDATVPLEGVRETEDPNPEPLAVETSKPVGAVTVKLSVSKDPETEKLPASEGVLTTVKMFETEPAAPTEGVPLPDVVAVTETLSSPRP